MLMSTQQQPEAYWNGYQWVQRHPPVQAPGEWWYDGRKWRPPVPQLSGRQIAKQLPGALLGLTLLLCLLAVLLVFLWGLVSH